MCLFQGTEILRACMAVMVCWASPCKPRGVHRVDNRVEDHHVEVPQENREGREQRLIIVHRGGRVRYPLREMTQREVIEPQ